MSENDQVNILLVDDQAGKLLTYEAILHELGENLLRATSGREALEHLLKSEVAVILVDVCMPDLDGFQLAAMIREHPRFQKTAMIFISAIHLTDVDRLRGYEMGAVDYVPVPVIPEVLRAKVKVFCELYRKTRQLEALNADLEQRVFERTAELEAAAAELKQSERRRSLALAAGNMGSWEWDREADEYFWDEGQYRIFGVSPDSFALTAENIRKRVHPDDWTNLQIRMERLIAQGENLQIEFRVVRPNGEMRWCSGVAAVSNHWSGINNRISGVTIDITDRKKAEDHQALLTREVDHRAKNALALVQSIIRLTKAASQPAYVTAVEGRIRALSKAHNVLAQSRWQGAKLGGLVDEELAPYRTGDANRIVAHGPDLMLQPSAAQTLALALHELATNAAKYGAFSSDKGRLNLTWEVKGEDLLMHWIESGGPTVSSPTSLGFGSRIISASVERQLDGEVSFDWQPEGLRCKIVFSCEGKMGLASPIESVRRHSDPANSERRLIIKGNRILVVEDESLVALALSETLSQLGFEVVGPIGNLSDANEIAHSATIDAAILDVNLNGEMSYPLAEALVHRGVPFIFVTGYGPESIDTRFSKILALQKPIERDSLHRIFGAATTSAIKRKTDLAPTV